jgi:hypothetical protein
MIVTRSKSSHLATNGPALQSFRRATWRMSMLSSRAYGSGATVIDSAGRQAQEKRFENPALKLEENRFENPALKLEENRFENPALKLEENRFENPGLSWIFKPFFLNRQNLTINRYRMVFHVSVDTARHIPPGLRVGFIKVTVSFFTQRVALVFLPSSCNDSKVLVEESCRHRRYRRDKSCRQS